MNPDEAKAKLLEYADLKRSIASLEARAVEMKPEVSEIVARLNPDDREVKIPDVGTFSVSARRKYAYPAPVEAIRADLKAAEAEAVATGAATYAETEVLTFRGEGEK